jgi:hypothetical protein
MTSTTRDFRVPTTSPGAIMNAQTLPNSPNRCVRRQTRLVIVRANGPLYYSIAAASLLEATAPQHAERLLHLYRGDHALCDWMRTEWLPRKAARARELREYVENTWPEFDWLAAHEQHRALMQEGRGAVPQRPTAAHEALARCTAAAQSALFYRAVARWADDTALREMARAMAQEESQSFAYFRAAFERRARVERVGFAATWRTTLACVRCARDTHVRLAFDVLVAQCGPNVPFPALDYLEFVRRMKSVVERHARLGLAERLLFWPWNKIPVVPVTECAQPVATSFRPVLAKAA